MPTLLLEYRAAPTPPSAHGYPYLPDLYRVRGEWFAILRIDPQKEFPPPYWMTRDQVVAVRDMLTAALKEWPLEEHKPIEGGLLSPAASAPHALAR